MSTQSRSFLLILLFVSFSLSLSAYAMDDSNDKTEEDKQITTVTLRRDVRQTPLEERREPAQILTFRGMQVRVSNEVVRQTIEFLQYPSLTPQRLEHEFNAFARRYGLSQQVMNEVVIGPILNQICPRISFPLSIQTQHRAMYLSQYAERLPAIEAPQPRYLKIVCSLIPYFPFEITVPDPESSLRRPSRLLINGAAEEREETPSTIVRVQQKAFDWTYTTSEYMENHPYITIMWLVVLSFLFNVLRH